MSEGDKNLSGESNYSSYIEASAGFNLNDVALSAGIGITPWSGIYTDKFDVLSVSLSATKEIKITDNFSLPVFAQVIFAPAYKDTYFVAGISF